MLLNAQAHSINFGIYTQLSYLKVMKKQPLQFLKTHLITNKPEIATKKNFTSLLFFNTQSTKTPIVIVLKKEKSPIVIF